MNTDLTTIDFHGAALIARPGATPAETLVAMKPVAEGMGLAWQTQHRKLREHPVLAEGITELMMPSASGPQTMTALPLSRLNFWLATIQSNKVPDPETRERILSYQRECADVLFAHFFSKAAKPELAPDARLYSGMPETRTGRKKLIARIIDEIDTRNIASKSTVRRYINNHFKSGVNGLDDNELVKVIDMMRKDFLAINDHGTAPKPGRRITDGLVKLELRTTPDKALRILEIVNE